MSTFKARHQGEIDPRDPKNHGRVIWVTYHPKCFPTLICAKLHAYTAGHQLLPTGTHGPNVCIWGYSVYKKESGFRTLGTSIDSLDSPIFWSEHGDALNYIRRLTTPHRSVLLPSEGGSKP